MQYVVLLSLDTLKKRWILQ